MNDSLPEVGTREALALDLTLAWGKLAKHSEEKGYVDIDPTNEFDVLEFLTHLNSNQPQDFDITFNTIGDVTDGTNATRMASYYSEAVGRMVVLDSDFNITFATLDEVVNELCDLQDEAGRIETRLVPVAD